MRRRQEHLATGAPDLDEGDAADPGARAAAGRDEVWRDGGRRPAHRLRWGRALGRARAGASRAQRVSLLLRRRSAIRSLAPVAGRARRHLLYHRYRRRGLPQQGRSGRPAAAWSPSDGAGVGVGCGKVGARVRGGLEQEHDGEQRADERHPPPPAPHPDDGETASGPRWSLRQQRYVLIAHAALLTHGPDPSRSPSSKAGREGFVRRDIDACER